MKERPILFRGEMVNAILDGRKSQTRRCSKCDEINKTPSCYQFKGFTHLGKEMELHAVFLNKFTDVVHQIKSPYGKPKDRLWVRETWAKSENSFDSTLFCRATDKDIKQHALSYSEREKNWRPSIFMTRWASRILLEITSVRVERLQDITEEDARAEGVRNDPKVEDLEVEGSLYSSLELFQGFWRLINGNKSWEDNPWVWVVEFKRIAQ